MRAVVAMLALASAGVAGAVPLRYLETTVEGFPTLRDAKGNRIAKGHFQQSVEDGVIRVRATYRLNTGDEVEETAELSTANDELAQQAWSWERRRGDTVLERYTVDFSTGTAHSTRLKKGRPEERSAKLGAIAGKTFSGIGFEYALRNLSPSLTAGKRAELDAIAFTPTPRRAKVSITRKSTDTVQVSGSPVPADHFVIRPMVPGVARWLGNVSDNHLWFSAARPPSFLRARVTMMSLGVVQIDAYGRAAQARTPPRP